MTPPPVYSPEANANAGPAGPKSGGGVKSSAVAILTCLILTAACFAQEQKEAPPSPIRVRFETEAVPKLHQAVPVTMVVERNPKGPPLKIEAGSRLELVLRVPEGVRLSGEGWVPVDLPPEEEEDPTGPWFLFEWRDPIEWKEPVQAEGAFVLTQVPALLEMMEEGSNWLIVGRARLIQGSTSWKASGVILATLEGTQAKFHSEPIPGQMPDQNSVPIKAQGNAKANGS